MQGRADHQTVEAAVDAIIDGQVPGWRVTYDEIGLEMVRQGRQRTSLLDAVVAVEDPMALFTRGRAESPQRVWVVVLEQEAPDRREVVKFLLVGGSDDNPEWLRIRPDASVPVESR
jgi:PleD family two-component response regulator